MRLCSQLSRSAPGHLEDVAIAEVDDPDAGRQVPLLGQRVAVVPGHGLVDGSGWGRDGAQGAHGWANAAGAPGLPGAVLRRGPRRRPRTSPWTARWDTSTTNPADSWSCCGQGRGHGDGLLADGTAPGAHQVHVGLLVDRVVGGRAVVQVGVGDQPGLVEGLERAVDRRQADVGHGALDLGRQLVDRGVPGLEQRLQDGAALGGAAQPGGAQPGIPVRARLVHGYGAVPSGIGSSAIARWLLIGWPIAAMS